MSILLSEKHGLNPSVCVCPVCGKDMAIALFGRLEGDAQAPAVTKNSELCDDCKSTHVTVIEVHTAINRKPTGNRFFIPKESIVEELRGNEYVLIDKVTTKEMFNL